MTVLITGSSGFIGRTLARSLSTDSVVGLDLTAENAPPDIHTIVGDVTDFERVMTTINAVKPAVIYHLAAYSHPSDVIAKPVEGVRTNVLGTVNVLEAVLRVRQKDKTYEPQIIVAGTVEEYGSTISRRSLPSDARLRPYSLYAGSKAAMSMMVNAYAATGLRCFVVRFPNIYGPGQSTKNLVPRAIECALRGETLTLVHGGMDVKEWLYVQDLCDGLVRQQTLDVLDRAFSGIPANIRSITLFLDMVFAKLGKDIRTKVSIDMSGSSNCAPRVYDPYFQFVPSTVLEEGLTLTVQAALEKDAKRGT